ncbi:hypothetical protein M117_2214 [Bacteroides fragilis str. 3774 T13]|nr:hypothetical protein M117_2214 [Bacteroides fragilis str. 3774 T13]
MIRRKDTRYRLRYKGPKKGNCLKRHYTKRRLLKPFFTKGIVS